MTPGNAFPQTDPRPPSDDDERAIAEVRRISELVRAATRDLPDDIEPAHHARWFEALAGADRRSDAGA